MEIDKQKRKEIPCEDPPFPTRKEIEFWGMIDYIANRYRDRKPGKIIHSDTLEHHNKYRTAWRTGLAATLENAIIEGNILNKEATDRASMFIEYFLEDSKVIHTDNHGETVTTPEQVQKANQLIEDLYELSKDKETTINQAQTIARLEFIKQKYYSDYIKGREKDVQARRQNRRFSSIAANIENGLDEKIFISSAEPRLKEYLQWFKERQDPLDKKIPEVYILDSDATKKSEDILEFALSSIREIH